MHAPSSPVLPSAAPEGASFRFVQRPLPYAYDALEPHIDAQTMRLHYEKHHAKYVEEANKELEGVSMTPDSAASLFASISDMSAKLRNNAGGAWNHDFFWHTMRPTAAMRDMPGTLRGALNASFGSMDAFRDKFTEQALGRFGSGWAWLVSSNGRLEIGSSPNQDGPLMADSLLRGEPLLGLDVWEHAYYLRYQNKRAEYVTNWWNVVDWDTVAERLALAK